MDTPRREGVYIYNRQSNLQISHIGTPQVIPASEGASCWNRKNSTMVKGCFVIRAAPSAYIKTEIDSRVTHVKLLIGVVYGRL